MLDQASQTNVTIQLLSAKQAVFDKLAPRAQDLLAALASQAYIEQIFSASGLLSNGKMNRMDKSLQMRSWMKVHTGPLRDTGFL